MRAALPDTTEICLATGTAPQKVANARAFVKIVVKYIMVSLFEEEVSVRRSPE